MMPPSVASKKEVNMNLSQVQYKNCDKCSRSMPMAHIIPQKAHAEHSVPRPDRFKAHDNPICVPCIRKEMRLIERKGNQAGQFEMNRHKILSAMLGAQ